MSLLFLLISLLLNSAPITNQTCIVNDLNRLLRPADLRFGKSEEVWRLSLIVIITSQRDILGGALKELSFLDLIAIDWAAAKPRSFAIGRARLTLVNASISAELDTHELKNSLFIFFNFRRVFVRLFHLKESPVYQWVLLYLLVSFK